MSQTIRNTRLPVFISLPLLRILLASFSHVLRETLDRLSPFFFLYPYPFFYFDCASFYTASINLPYCVQFNLVSPLYPLLCCIPSLLSFRVLCSFSFLDIMLCSLYIFSFTRVVSNPFPCPFLVPHVHTALRNIYPPSWAPLTCCCVSIHSQSSVLFSHIPVFSFVRSVAFPFTQWRHLLLHLARRAPVPLPPHDCI